jgi:hypothetical protein
MRRICRFWKAPFDVHGSHHVFSALHAAASLWCRTFSLLDEAAEAPGGTIAQVVGHKPSAIAEGYRPRSIDALRPYLALIQKFILDKAGVTFDPAKAVTGGWRVVKGCTGLRCNA